jgi:hypothetical protein
VLLGVTAQIDAAHGSVSNPSLPLSLGRRSPTAPPSYWLGLILREGSTTKESRFAPFG